MGPEVVNALANGGAAVAVIFAIWLVAKYYGGQVAEMRAAIDRNSTEMAARFEVMQTRFLEELRLMSKESAEDRRLYQDQMQGLTNRLIGITTDVTVAMRATERAVQGVEGAVKELQSIVKDLQVKVNRTKPTP